MNAQLLTNPRIGKNQQDLNGLFLQGRTSFVSENYTTTLYERELFERIRAMEFAKQRLQNSESSLHERFDLLQFIQMGRDARAQLIRMNMHQTVMAVQQFLGSEMLLEALLQEGNLGLSNAVDSYNLNDEISFADFAAEQIKQAIENTVAYSGQ